MSDKPFGLEFLEPLVSSDVFGASGTNVCCHWYSYGSDGAQTDGGDDGCHND